MKQKPMGRKKKKNRKCDNIKVYMKDYHSGIVGRARILRDLYIRNDRKYGRIGSELPNDYVTVQDVVRLITKKCAHFDECGTYGWRKIGLNRLDDSLPHIKSNVEPCCSSCNKKQPRLTRRIPRLRMKNIR